MERYGNKSRKSGVRSFEIGNDYIVVVFEDGGRYRYTYRSAGKKQIEHMKKLALKGLGLSTFISQYVKDRYESTNKF